MVLPARVPLDDDRTVPCRRAGTDPELWYPKPGRAGMAAKAEATVLCRDKCHRTQECLARALALGEVSFGIFGGLTAPERAALLRAVDNPQPQRAVKPRPAPPPRSRTRFAGWKNTAPPSPDDLRNVFDAARAFLDGDGTRVVIAVRFGVSEPRMAQAAAMLRWCPDLEGDVVDGWVPWRHGAAYAQQVKQWEMDRETAAAEKVAA